MSRGQEVAAEIANMRLGELGWTQGKLAEAAGVDGGTISRFLNAATWPQVRNRVRISLALWDDTMKLDQLAKVDGERTTDDLLVEVRALRSLFERYTGERSQE